jgi:hypothetical protein
MDPLDLKNSDFNKALSDYYFLITNEYPEKGSLKIVGDRYHLRTEVRTLLYRGITSTEKSKKRTSRIVPDPITPLLIDGYNVLMTLMNYRLGRFVFISTDGICRDAAWQFGKIGSEPVFNECIILLTDFLRLFRNLQIIIYLDNSNKNCREHSDLLKINTEDNTRIERVASADNSLLKHQEGTIATSDSEIIDGSILPVFDIPLRIITEKYQARLYSLKKKLIDENL